MGKCPWGIKYMNQHICRCIPTGDGWERGKWGWCIVDDNAVNEKFEEANEQFDDEYEGIK